MPGIDLAARERLRRSFRPPRIRLLFIGESPPASGRFFYRGDSGLYRAMREAFQAREGFHEMAPSIHDEDFLATFRELGCYLIDLCGEPVDHLDARSRRALCRAGEATLARRIASLQPERIATLLRSIEGSVAAAASRAHWSGQCLNLPYPGRWVRRRRIFVEQLAPVIRDLKGEYRAESRRREVAGWAR